MPPWQTTFVFRNFLNWSQLTNKRTTTISRNPKSDLPTNCPTNNRHSSCPTPTPHHRCDRNQWKSRNRRCNNSNNCHQNINKHSNNPIIFYKTLNLRFVFCRNKRRTNKKRNYEQHTDY